MYPVETGNKWAASGDQGLRWACQAPYRENNPNNKKEVLRPGV
jgi:hypothetical protein